MRELDWNVYCDTAAQLAAEGIVMLKNDNGALPLAKGQEIALFGRIQNNYYKSGTGSGGMVNVPFVTNIDKSLEDAGIKLNERLVNTYIEWEKENPYDLGEGWGGTPWSQKEMVPEEALVKELGAELETAVVVFGRTAGEEQDNKPKAGSYFLSEEEKTMLAMVRAGFKKVVVVLNVGNIIDMKCFGEIQPDAIIYGWQGGMMGGKATAMVLTGEVNPCGKLPDTIAESIEDYPSTANFGVNNDEDIYAEDIYVGYRYFETFAKDKVLYPFGFGLSYTNFEIKCESADNKFGSPIDKNDSITFNVSVKNTGKTAGKETVMLFVKAPNGKLGKAARVLCGYEKTALLAPGESCTVSVSTCAYMISSYDDSGVTGNKSCYLLEAGDYEFYIGSDVRSAEPAYTMNIADASVIESLKPVMSPVKSFSRMIAVEKDGIRSIDHAKVPVLDYNEEERILSDLPKELEITGDKGIKLADVKSGRASMDEFIAQFSAYQLNCIIRGEGMGCPRVTAGTASAFGGVTDELEAYGIPAVCCSDGPSGMRLDCGTKAFSHPNGTMIAASFNKELVEQVYELLGLEMSLDNVDCLLGPGMNIHRNPLNGRNFEYFSEDPFLTGSMAAAQLKGMHKSGVTGTIKHFAANNRETNRHFMDSVVSERALREIYLKGFEIAVREGKAATIMTTYGKINGLWTACNHGLVTEILRDEWGFKGAAMTDWWANLNDRKHPEPDKENFSAMVRAQNDLYMVCANSSDHEDNIAKALEDGSLTIAELQRCAKNICSFILSTNAFKRVINEDYSVKMINAPSEDEFGQKDVKFYDLKGKLTIDLSDIDTRQGTTHCYALVLGCSGRYKMTLTGSSTGSELAQIPVTVFSMGSPFGTYTWNGTGGKPVSFSNEIPMFSRFTTVRLFFAQSGLKLHSISYELLESFEEGRGAEVEEE
ncbi:MAG: glycoside hydrolase family 3 C-terminal domain-containing protein [Lachnospiraceae bacterium]|nr:glycoside hydrolase family 3 C-terminal domain-containing protein [Lachnospiraceae bacterium]